MDVNRVRAILGDIDTSYIPDSTIKMHIDNATTYIQQFISTDHPLYEQCILYRAAYLTLLTYAELVRREVGDLPATASYLLDLFRRLADELLEKAKSTAASVPTTTTLIELTKSWEYEASR